MPEVVSCPECMSKLKVPETLLGKKVKCPKCTFSFLAVAVPKNEPAEEPEEEEAPPSKRRAADEDFGEERTAKRRPAPREEEEEEEAPRSRRRDEDEDEDREERSRSRRRRDEDDDYDRPRSRPRRDDYDDDDDFEDEPLRKRKKGKASDWQKVRMGITFAIAGLFTILGGWLFSICGGIFGALLFAGSVANANANRPPNAGGVFASLGIMALLVMAGYGIMIIGRGLEVTGCVFDIWAASRRGAKVLAIVSLVLAGLSTLAFCGGFGGAYAGSGPSYYDSRYGGGYGGYYPTGPGPLGLLALGAPPLLFAEWIVFLFFLRAVALNFDDHGLARSILFLVYLTIGTLFPLIGMCCFPVLTILGIAATNPDTVSRDTMTVFGVVQFGLAAAFVIMSIVALIWYIVTLFQVRGLLTRRLTGRR